MCGITKFAIRATIDRSLRALRAQNRKKVSKRVFWGSAKKSPKIPEKVKKYTKKSNFGHFLTFSGIFGGFFADPPKDSFWDFFEILGPEGPETPVNGRSDRNTKCCFPPLGRQQLPSLMWCMLWLIPETDWSWLRNQWNLTQTWVNRCNYINMDLQCCAWEVVQTTPNNHIPLWKYLGNTKYLLFFFARSSAFPSA